MESGLDPQMSNTSHGSEDESLMAMGSGSFGFSHYRRRCKIRAPCCDEIFDCRHCHNESKQGIAELNVEPYDEDQGTGELRYVQANNCMVVTTYNTSLPYAERYRNGKVEQLHKIFKLCGSPSEEYWRKSKLPHATIFKPQALELMETLLSIDPADRGSAASALHSEVMALLSGFAGVYTQNCTANMFFVHAVCDDTCREAVLDPTNELFVCTISGHCFDRLLSPVEMEPDTVDSVVYLVDGYDKETFAEAKKGLDALHKKQQQY
ncbi:unnamed protein product [Camellia sinensis]